jgi:hypothetical protein
MAQRVHLLLPATFLAFLTLTCSRVLRAKLAVRVFAGDLLNGWSSVLILRKLNELTISSGCKE